MLVAALAAGACGRYSSGEAEPDEAVAVGSEVGLGETAAGEAPPDAASGGVPAEASEPTPSAEASEPVDASHHPRAPNGEVMHNVTLREIDGLVLQLSVDELKGQPGDLLFDVLVVNERDTALFFDPTYADAIVITDKGGNRVWSAGECELRADSDYGHPTLKPGDRTVLAFRYSSDGDGNQACVIPAGDYTAVAHFAWCHPERHDGGACRELTTSQSHPLRIRFGGG